MSRIVGRRARRWMKKGGAGDLRRCEEGCCAALEAAEDASSVAEGYERCGGLRFAKPEDEPYHVIVTLTCASRSVS